MIDYVIEKKFLTYYEFTRKIKTDDLKDLTQKQLDEINDKALPNKRWIRKAFEGKTKKVSKKTFIIPVKDGAVTGYLFEKATIEDPGSLAPLIIFYHGGGWVWGNIELYSYYCARLAEATDARVLFVDYRLSPRYKFPTALEDCYSTLEWVAKGTNYWRVDPDRIFLLGDCSGGNLAAVVSKLARDRKGPSIAGQILFYPITDARMRTNSYEKYTNTPTVCKGDLAFAISCYITEPKDILNPNFSPLLSKDHSRLPPTLIIGAEIDPLRDDGIMYADALASADTPVKYLEAKGSYHGFAIFPKVHGSDEAQCAVRQFVSGKDLKKVVLMTEKELKKSKAEEIRNARNKKSTIQIID